MSNTLKSDMRPTFIDNCGYERFIPNEIVLHLYNSGSVDLSKFSEADRREFVQLVGYRTDITSPAYGCDEHP